MSNVVLRQLGHIISTLTPSPYSQCPALLPPRDEDFILIFSDYDG